MQITQEELLKCKRAVLILADLAKVAVEMTGAVEPVSVKQDRAVLLQVLKRLEAFAK